MLHFYLLHNFKDFCMYPIAQIIAIGIPNLHVLMHVKKINVYILLPQTYYEYIFKIRIRIHYTPKVFEYKYKNF